MKRALIIGYGPISGNIVGQYEAIGYEVVCLSETDAERCAVSDFDEIVVLSSADVTDVLAEDNRVIAFMRRIAERTSPDVRARIHLLLQSQESLWMLNARDYKDELHPRVEVYAFTMEDAWAKNVVVTMPTKKAEQGSVATEWLARGLDYKPITFESRCTVHLVVFGTSGQAEALVKNAALVAHYPNYIRNNKLRTRITIIDQTVGLWYKSFISRHRNLMDNCYYRFIDVERKACDTHCPMYEGQRQDFVDVEWEFVEADIYNIVVQDKLQTWAESEEQVLSVAICHNDDAKNIGQARVVADLLQGCTAPIYVRQKESTLADMMRHSDRFTNIVPFGMLDRGYDISLPLLRMAQRVKYVYDYCYDFNITSDDEAITAPSFIDDTMAEQGWLGEKKAVKRYSNICNAMTLATKMRSLGHSDNDWNTFYAISQAEVGLIAQVEHNRWNVEEMLLGYRPCNDEEQAEIELDISKKAFFKDRLVHYDLRAYDDLRPDATGKNVNTYDICLSASIPLIAYSVMKGGEQ